MLTEAYCDYEADWYNCFEKTTFRCMSEEKIREIRATAKTGFDELEEKLKKVGLRISFQVSML